MFVVLKSKLVEFPVNTSHIQCTELDTLQRVTKYSSTRSQKEGSVNDFVSHNLRKNSASSKGHCFGRKNIFIFFTWDWSKRENMAVDKHFSPNK